MLHSLFPLSVLAVSLFAVRELPKQDATLAQLLQSPPQATDAIAETPVGAQVAAAPTDRAVLGVVVGPVDPALVRHLRLPPNRGLLLMSVAAGQPAANAGLEQYDVLLSIDGIAVGSREELGKVLDSKTPGESVAVQVRRGVETLDLHVELAAASREDANARIDLLLPGVRNEMESELRRLERLTALQSDRANIAESLRLRELELAAREGDFANDRDQLAAELAALTEHLSHAQNSTSRLALEEGAAKAEQLSKALLERAKVSEDAAHAARDHLTALQNALASKVERMHEAQDELTQRAEVLRAKIESEFLAKAASLKDRISADDALALREEATKVAEEAKRALLDVREHLSLGSEHARSLFERRSTEIQNAERLGELARANELRAEAEAHRQLLEHVEADRKQHSESGDVLNGRLGAIEERLERIEELLTKLVKRGSQN